MWNKWLTQYVSSGPIIFFSSWFCQLIKNWLVCMYFPIQACICNTVVDNASSRRRNWCELSLVKCAHGEGAVAWAVYYLFIVYMHRYACGRQVTLRHCFSKQPSTVYFETGSLLCRSVVTTMQGDWSAKPKSACFHLPSHHHQDCKCALPCLNLHVRRSETRVLMLYGKHFRYWGITPCCVTLFL